MQETDSVIREYKTRDAKDIVRSGYPFSDVNEWGSLYKDWRLKIHGIFERRARQRLVAYSLSKKKAVGTAKMEEISKTIWHVGGLFVCPSHRRRGIGSLLTRAEFEYLKKINVKKAVANVETSNFPSIEKMKKQYDKILSQQYTRFSGVLQYRSKVSNSFLIRRYHKNDVDELYRIFQKCINAEWRSFLEINRNKFLERFWGNIRSGGLFHLWIKRRVLVAEEKGAIVGYVLMPSKRFPIFIHKNNKRARLYLFLLPCLPNKVAISFLQQILNILSIEGYGKVNVYFANTNNNLMDKITEVLCDLSRMQATKFLLGVKTL